VISSHYRPLHELQAIHRQQKAGFEAPPEVSSVDDPEIKKYVVALEQLKKIKAFEFNIPQPGSCAVRLNTVAISYIDPTTLRELREFGIEVPEVLGYYWPHVPLLVGPKSVVAPRTHPRQKPVLERVRGYYERKKRSGWHLTLLDRWLRSGLVPCSYTLGWGDYGAALLLPASAVSHASYRNPRWYLLDEADAVLQKIERPGSLPPLTLTPEWAGAAR
jgi:hypothetical protein